MSQYQSKEYYPFLDGFRAVAILWVLLHHLPFLDIEDIDVTGPFHVAVALFRRLKYVGFLGVDIFFIISGFLITGLLIGDLDDKIRMKRFYIRRFFKIVPHCYFIIFIGIAAACFFSPQNSLSLSSVLSPLGFLSNYVATVDPLVHLWSIAVEEHFYLIYPLLLSFICFLNPVPAQRRKILFVALMILILLGNYLRYDALLDKNIVPWQQTHVRFDALIWGCLLKLLEPRLRSLPGKESIASVCFGTGILLFSLCYFKYILMVWWFFTVVSIASVLLVAAALMGYGRLLRFLENPHLRWVGRNSYGIYLWHYIVIKCPDIVWHNTLTIVPLLEEFPLIGVILSMIFYGSLSLYLGAMTTNIIERYCLELRKKVVP